VRSGLILLGLGLFSLGALADEEKPYPPPPEYWACYPDFQKFCPKVTPGGGRIKACLAARKSELSGRCVSALHTVGALPPDDQSAGAPAPDDKSKGGS
jgi:hypothetical protein